MRLARGVATIPIDAATTKSLVIDSTLPEDHIEHVYVRIADQRCDVILFFSLGDLQSAQICGAALSSRLMRDCFPGWSLRRVSYEPAA